LAFKPINEIENLNKPMQSASSHGYGSVTASPYSVEEVSGSRPGRVILKTLKIVSTASLFGAEHIRDREGGYS
jgi:hypothetical protein